MTPDAKLLIAPGCPHCGSVLEHLSTLVKEGAIGQLEIINLASRPEAATEAGTRSVPWFRIGDMSFTGAHNLKEIRQWAEQAHKGQGRTAYYLDRLDNRELDAVEQALHGDPSDLCELIASLKDKDMPMVVKIGIGAVVESFAGHEALTGCLKTLEALSNSDDPGLRADIAHYLSFINMPESIAILQGMRSDADPNVQEIVEDSLQELATPCV
jgi:glutaredoxin